MKTPCRKNEAPEPLPEPGPNVPRYDMVFTYVIVALLTALVLPALLWEVYLRVIGQWAGQ